MLQIGSVLDGKYKILNEIGHGGMSTVYLALNERANKTWAVKEVRKEGGTQSEVLSQGLVAETEMLKKLSHPNLPSIIDVIDNNDSFIIVMDYIEGKSLQNVLEHSGAQDPDQVVEWAKQLCGVLGYLHGRKPPIIYRDMKPANVMLKPDGNVTLIDFGTAREYKAHSLGDTTWLGTRGYAAPEQFGGQGETDARTDIYNLGATIYHLLTGYSPADTNFVIRPIGDLRPELKDTGYEYLVSKCCQPEREKRFQNCEELQYVLDHIHDYDNSVIGRRDLQWSLWIATIAIAFLAMIGTVGFKLTENNAIKSAYSSLLRDAQRSSSVIDVKDVYKNASELQPTNPELYEILMDKILEDSVFTPEEERVLDSIKPSLNRFETQNSTEYADFAFDLGRAYFYYYTDGYTKAANYLEMVSGSSSALADENSKKIAGTLYKIADAIGKTAAVGSDKDWGSDSNVYYERWMLLTSVTNHPETIDSETGGQAYSIGMYRELLRQIQTRINEYKNAGVTKADFENAIAYAEEYMSNVVIEETQSTGYKNLVDQTRVLLRSAGQQVAGSYKVPGTEN